MQESAVATPDDVIAAIAAREVALTSARRWGVVLLCALICLLDGYDMVVAPISVPVLAESWGLEASAFAAALTATVLGMALGAAFLAPLGDRFGRRPVILASFFFVGLASLLTPLSATVLELAVFRLVTGLGMGASLANALALASEFALQRLRSRIITCVYSMSAVGSVLGGFLAPPLLAAYGWQGLYAVGGLLPLALLPLLWMWLPESIRFQVLRSQGAPGSRSETTASSKNLLASIHLLLARPYRARTLLLWSLYLLCTFTVYVISSWLPTLMRLHGWSIENSVHAIMVFSFGGIVGGFLLGWLVDRGRITTCLLASFVCTAVAMVALNVVPASIWIWMSLIGVMGGGMIGVSYAMAALAAIVYPTDLRASGIGAASAMGRVGATLAPAVGGWLLALGWTVTSIFTGLIVPMIAGVLIVMVFARAFAVKDPLV